MSKHTPDTNATTEDISQANDVNNTNQEPPSIMIPPEGACTPSIIQQYFANFQSHSLAYLNRIYSDQAYFKDPFHEVRGVDAIANIYASMFYELDNPRFEIKHCLADGVHVVLIWELRFRFKKRKKQQEDAVIRGASHLKCSKDDGRIQFHRDYWDAAEELYEKFPLLGGFMRLLKRQVSTKA